LRSRFHEGLKISAFSGQNPAKSPEKSGVPCG